MNQVKNLYTHTTSSIEAIPDEKAGNTVPTVGQNVATIDLPDMYIKIWDVGGQMTLRRLWTSYYKSCHGVIFVVDSSDLGTLDIETNEDEGDGALKTPVTPGEGKWHGKGRRKSSYSFPAFTEGDGEGDIGGMGKDRRKISGHAFTPSMLSSHTQQGRLDECRAVLESVLGHPDMSGIPILVLANKQDREDSLEVVRIKEGFVRKVFEGEKGQMVRDSRVLPVSALKGTGVKEAVDWVRTRVIWNKEGRPPVMR